MNTNHLVSVCLPTYNGEIFLSEALDSLVSQDYKNIELIVSDDDSKDATLEITRRFKTKVNFPVLILNHSPSGIGANWNNCIRHAGGKYIKFLFQDDVLDPGCISQMVKVIQENREVGLVSCKRKILHNEEVSKVEEWKIKYGNLQKGLIMAGDNNISIIDKSLFKSPTLLNSPLNKIGEPTAVLFEKKILNKVGMFREDLDQILDYEMFYRILKFEKIAIINKPLVDFRLHPQQATRSNVKNSNNEHYLYERILLKDFFWYLSTKGKVRLLKKHFLPW